MQPQQRAGGPGQGPFPPFETKLEKEEEILDGFLSAQARGQLAADAWDALHAAAQRDDRLSELAFAYEAVSQGKRLKTLPGATSAEFLYHAGRFFSDVFGDAMGAVSYLERALETAPS